MKSKSGHTYSRDNLRGFFNPRLDKSIPVVKKRGKSKGGKFYAVKVGRTNNIIVKTWTECERLVSGYSRAKYKSFCTMKEAEQYLYKKHYYLNKADRDLIKSCPF